MKCGGVVIGRHELDIMSRMTVCVFEVLEKAWASLDCSLIDMKIEFGVNAQTGTAFWYATFEPFNTMHAYILASPALAISSVPAWGLEVLPFEWRSKVIPHFVCSSLEIT